MHTTSAAATSSSRPSPVDSGLDAATGPRRRGPHPLSQARVPLTVLLLLAATLPVACTPVEPVDSSTSGASGTSGASDRTGPPTAVTPILLKTRSRLVGSFSSAAQADADSNFRAIDLHMVPIWTDRTDGPWLYVEQAVAEARDRPYRQRIYRLLPVRAANGRDAVLSVVHTLPGDPLAFAGAWRTPEAFEAIAPGELEVLDGCSVTLEADGPGRIHGSTADRTCRSTFGGAAYTTSEVELFDDRIETLDRGYDTDGVQVWGSEHGPYRFDRVTTRRTSE